MCVWSMKVLIKGWRIGKVVIEGEEVVVVKMRMRMKCQWLRAVEQRVRLEPAELNIPWT